MIFRFFFAGTGTVAAVVFSGSGKERETRRRQEGEMKEMYRKEQRTGERDEESDGAAQGRLEPCVKFCHASQSRETIMSPPESAERF